MRTPHLLVQNKLDFSKFMMSQCGQGRVGQFSRFCANVFYGRPLTCHLPDETFFELTTKMLAYFAY